MLTKEGNCMYSNYFQMPNINCSHLYIQCFLKKILNGLKYKDFTLTKYSTHSNYTSEHNLSLSIYSMKTYRYASDVIGIFKNFWVKLF